MSFFGVTIEQIESIVPISGADTIDRATLFGKTYEFVVPKGKFAVKELVLYFPVDSVLPLITQEKLGLVGRLSGSNKDRIKVIKLRGQYSCGVVAKLDLIDELIKFNPNTTSEEITNFFGVTKYEPPVIPCKSANLNALPCGLTKYDIESVNSDKRLFDSLMDERVVVTEKLEGCVDETTLIDTLEYGKLSIKQIIDNCINCHIKSYDFDTDSVVYNKLINTSIKENINNWFELQLDNGKNIKITDNHYVWLPELKCWRQVKDLKEGDSVLID